MLGDASGCVIFLTNGYSVVFFCYENVTLYVLYILHIAMKTAAQLVISYIQTRQEIRIVPCLVLITLGALVINGKPLGKKR